MFVQQLLLQFSMDFDEIWFFIIPNIVSNETTKKSGKIRPDSGKI